MSPTRASRLLLAAFACLALGGCISLFPKSKPAQLYRFDNEPLQAGQTLPAAGARVIARGNMRFETAAAGDRILTVTGADTAYIAGSRWVAPAPVLFEEALIKAFAAGGGARLAEAGSSLHANELINIDVQTFETRYDQGPQAPPQVMVQVRVQLVRVSDHSVVGEQLFTSAQRASDNRVGPIVEAYDAGVRDLLAKLVAWTTQQG